MFYGKTHKQVSLVGELLMTSNPYWFNHQVVFFEAHALGMQAVYLPDHGLGVVVEHFLILPDVVIAKSQIPGEAAAGHAPGVFRFIKVNLRRNI